MSTVSITRCSTYDPQEVQDALRRLLEPLGGIAAFVKPGQRVLLKPNLLVPIRPERAATTHPAVVEAMIALVREAGGTSLIADSPGGPLHNAVGMRRLYSDTGMQDVADRTGTSLHYDSIAVQVATPDGVLLKRLDLLDVWQQVDVIIALPKLKTHGLTTITGATKILFGLVPGLTKSGYHAKLADVDRFCDMLLDIVAYVRPALYVMDGVLAMEGDGPGPRGTPRPLGALLASSDAVAMDGVACQIVGVAPDRLAMFQAAHRRGWWPVDIDVVGTPVADLAVTDFCLPVSAETTVRRSERTWLSRIVTQGLVPRPVPKRARCTACGTCQRICPVHAIDIVERLAHVDYSTCIRCYCCSEVCPEAAIDLEFSRLGRFVRSTGVLGRLR